MDLDDQIAVATPEGVELALALAGLGSRFIAGAIDAAIQLAAILILAILSGALGPSGGVLRAVFVVLAFGIWFFYNVLFEVLAHGRTPGKAMTHLRVVRDTGAPVDLPASAIRNLVRVLDGPLLLYLPTIVSIALAARNQRPGDLAAGTIVMREQPRSVRATPTGAQTSHSAAAGAHEAIVGWDVSAVSNEESAAVRRFLERRETLDVSARRNLALRLASGLRPKVSGVPEGIEAERFLEQLTLAKASRR